MTVVSFVFPPPLVPGDLVAVVAPSSPFSRDELLRGLAWLRGRYRVRMSPEVFARDGFLAGSDARRTQELANAFRDPAIKAVLAARGGYGAMRILGDAPWEELGRAPKWLVGFSDVTAFHVMAWRAGIASVHGPNVTGLGRDASPLVRAAWLASVERPGARRVWAGLRVVQSGRAEGPLVGGNLAMLEAMAAAGKLIVPDGAVLALEDVTERPYRIDRMLTALRLGGHLDRVSAIVLGGFEGCGPGPDGRTAEEVLEERTRTLGVPVVSGAPFGHSPHNEAFVLGVNAVVENDLVEISQKQ
jgi:muramoyltetrapeptide carboxypeptidase